MDEARVRGQVTRKVRRNRGEQLRRDQPVVKNPVRTGHLLQVERPIVFDRVGRVEVRGLMSEPQVLSDTWRDRDGLLVGTGCDM